MWAVHWVPKLKTVLGLFFRDERAHKKTRRMRSPAGSQKRNLLERYDRMIAAANASDNAKNLLFVQIPAGYLDFLKRPTEFAILMALESHARVEKDGRRVCWPSRKRLAEMVNCSVSTVQRAITRLAEAGVLKRSRRANRSTVYEMLIALPTKDDRNRKRTGTTTEGAPVRRPESAPVRHRTTPREQHQETSNNVIRVQTVKGETNELCTNDGRAVGTARKQQGRVLRKPPKGTGGWQGKAIEGSRQWLEGLHIRDEVLKLFCTRYGDGEPRKAIWEQERQWIAEAKSVWRDKIFELHWPSVNEKTNKILGAVKAKWEMATRAERVA